MQPADRRTIRFVGALLGGGEATRKDSGPFRIAFGERTATLDADQVRELIVAGVLIGDAGRCRAGGDARNWARRQLAGADGFGAQHRHDVRAADGSVINLSESPLARLAVAAPGEGEAFLAPHQVEAGERVRRLVERAGLQPRMTMSYSAAHVAGRKRGAAGAAAISDLAADARRTLADLWRVLPPDCAGVVLDVCGLLKGLQSVEMERGWPRRSAKLVLRIGLDQLARHYGLSDHATGAGIPAGPCVA